MSITIRHFFDAEDVTLGRLWEWYDSLAARSDVSSLLYIFGRFPGPPEDISKRPYVIQEWSPLQLLRMPLDPEEVWITRGWNPPMNVLVAIVAHLRGVPVLMWQERPGLTYEASDLRQAIRIWLRRRLLPILFIPYRRGTVLLGTGEEAATVFQELSRGSPTRVFPYPNPVADACLSREPRFREQYDVPLFLFAGRFEHRKAVDLIIDACEDLWRSGHRFRIRYVGDGPMKDTLEEHVRRSGNRVELYPYSDRERLIGHYDEADAVLLPSRFDGWGLPVHEGLASGLPVIVSDACGAADLVAQSGCGKVVRANDLEALKSAIAWVTGLTPQQREGIYESALQVACGLTIPELSDVLIVYCREASTLVARA